MKRCLSKLLLLVSILSVIVLTSCNGITSNQNANTSTNSNSSTIENKSGNMDESNSKNIKEQGGNISAKDNSTGNIKLIDKKDLIVTDGIDTISLDIPYKNFKTSKQEIKQENNFVGDVKSGEYVYKYYSHRYNDFTIYVSNANYNFKNRSIDDRFVTQITLKNSNFKTTRGLSIGQNLLDVVNKYGDGKQTKNDDTTTLFYQYRDMGLTFTIDQGYKVTAIILNIIVNK